MHPFRVWTRPAAMLEQAVGLIVLAGLGYKWLDIAESSLAQLLLSMATVLAMIAIALMLVKLGRGRIAATSSPGIVAWLLFAMSLAAAYQLIWWVPSLTGLRGQSISVALRFSAAFVLLVTFWANLLGSWAAKPAQP